VGARLHQQRADADAPAPTPAPVWVDASGRTPSGMPAPTRKDARRTRQRLLDAAGPIFAEKGFDGAHIREIVRAAGTNLGAVNRHFGSKRGLYREVLVHSHMALMQAEAPPTVVEFEDPAEGLREIMRFMLRLVLVLRGPESVAGQLIMQEIHDPTEVLDDLIRLFMVPTRQSIGALVGRMLGESDSDELREQCVNFVFGLCVFHSFGREVLTRVGTPPPRSDSEIDHLLDVLHPFVIAGIEGARARCENASSRGAWRK